MNSLINARLTASVILTVFLIVGGASVFGDDAHAQSASSRKSAEDALRAGLAAQKARRHDVAVRHFSSAIRAGSLARKQLTYALYRRAISNRAQKQSAQAISDLNSALFFKGDLSMRDRANAIEERMKAFKDAGVQPTAVAVAGPPAQWKPATSSASTPNASPRSRVVSSAPPRVLEPVQAVKARRSTSALAPTYPILAPAKPVAKTPAVASRSPTPFQTKVAPAPRVTAKPAAASQPSSVFSHATATVERGVGVPRAVRPTSKSANPTGPWQVATRSVPVVPARQNNVGRAETVSPVQGIAPASQAVRPGLVSLTEAATVARAQSDVPTKSDASTSSGGSVGQFFSDLFGGGGTSAVETGSLATASVKRPALTRDTSHHSSAAKPAALTAAKSAIQQPVQVAVAQPAVKPKAVRPAERSQARGILEIEVAVLRNRHRADALAQQLMVQYAGGGFWSAKKTARVIENRAGNEESVRYAVRYGVYNSRGELEAACATFKADGLGCEVVPQR